MNRCGCSDAYVETCGDTGAVARRATRRSAPRQLLGYRGRLPRASQIRTARSGRGLFIRRALKTADLEDNIRGAPDLVIEVLSPSNSASEIYDRENLCLENGAREFWVVDPDRRQVKVSTQDGRTVTYQSGQEIPLQLFGNARMALDAIFD